jgi:hypothetical protein
MRSEYAKKVYNNVTQIRPGSLLEVSPKRFNSNYPVGRGTEVSTTYSYGRKQIRATSGAAQASYDSNKLFDYGYLPQRNMGIEEPAPPVLANGNIMRVVSRTEPEEPITSDWGSMYYRFTPQARDNANRQLGDMNNFPIQIGDIQFRF